jgi:hypothetical protein
MYTECMKALACAYMAKLMTTRRGVIRPVRGTSAMSHPTLNRISDRGSGPDPRDYLGALNMPEQHAMVYGT